MTKTLATAAAAVTMLLSAPALAQPGNGQGGPPAGVGGGMGGPGGGMGGPGGGLGGGVGGGIGGGMGGGVGGGIGGGIGAEVRDLARGDRSGGIGMDVRDLARDRSRGAERANQRANERALSRANSNSVLTTSTVVRGSLSGLTLGQRVTGTSGTTLGTVERISVSNDGSVRAVLVRGTDGRLYNLPPATLTLSNGVLVTTSTRRVARGG